MNKKILGMFFVSVLFIAMASAMLVSYISNSVVADVSVEAPLVMTISSNGTEYSNSISLQGVYGGDDISFLTNIVNHASVNIAGDYEIIVSNDINNATCEDFTVTQIDNVNMTCFDNSGIAIFNGTSNYVNGTTTVNAINLTFALNIKPANYTITSQIEMA